MAGAPTMMNRLTDKAQEALRLAQQIMFARRHMQIDVEHVFLALVEAPDSLPVEIITRLGGNVPAMTRRLENALNNMPSLAAPPGPATGYITPRCNRVLQGAAREAEQLRDPLISTEHLLLAIADERSGASGDLLQEAEITPERILGALKAARATTGGHVSGAPEQPPALSGGKTVVNPPALARASGFSHGVATRGGRTLFLAGQIAADAQGLRVAPGDVVGQYRQAMSNLRVVVREAGGQMTDIVKLTIYVLDRDDYKAHLKELREAHRSFMGDYYPATALVQVARFFEDDVLVEIEGIAVIDDSES